ncbi:hypothetical protein V8F06_001980 [Rhypophila decipiens]
MSKASVPVRSPALRGRRGSIDHDRASQGPNGAHGSERFDDKLRKVVHLKLDVSTTPATERENGEREPPSRRSFALVSGRSSQHRPHLDEEDRQRRVAKHRRDGSAPASYDTSRRQRNGPGVSATNSQDELIGKDHAGDSFAARKRQPPEFSAKSKIISANSFPVSSSEGGLLTRSQSSVKASGSPRARTNETTLGSSSTPEFGGPPITAAMGQHAMATSSPDGTSDKKRESQAPASNSTSSITPSSNGDPNTLSKAKDLNSICREFEKIIDLQSKKIEKLSKLEERDKLLQQKNTDLCHELQELQERNDQLVKKNDELEIRAEDLVDMLASKATPTTNSGASLIPDTQVQARWNSLCFAIRQCVAEYVNPTGSLALIHESVFPRFHSLIPSHVAVPLRDKEGCQLLAQAVIWRILVEHVFGNGTRMSRMFWAGKFSEGTELKAFHGWRRQTASFLSDLADPEDVGAHIDGILAITESSLNCFLSVPWPATLRGRVHEIINSAISLDCDLSQQWAYWYVDYPSQPGRNGETFQRFDNALMKVPKSHDANQLVDLMISPALHKAGDSRGQGYEQVEVACKSEVICVEEPHPHMPQSPVWQYYQVPPGVPSVVDPRTQRLRQQHKQTSGGTEYGLSPGRRFLRLIGIDKND